MRKITSLFALFLLTVGAAMATVTQPTLTTDPENPTYYYIQNFRSGKFANYVSASDQLTQVDALATTALWYFVANGDGVSIVPATDPSVKLASHNSATADGAAYYLYENPYNAGTFVVSLTAAAGGYDCWDDQGGHTTIGTWEPRASDYEGTSWKIVEVAATKAQVDNNTVDFTLIEKKAVVMNKISALSSLSAYPTVVAAINAATTSAEVATALQGFEAKGITLLCSSGKYLVVGESACSYVDVPSDYNNYIQLVSIGDGTFYLKGFKSEKYVGQTRMSAAVSTTADAQEPYAFSVYNGKIVVKNTTGGDYAYIHNGGSGCVGWSAAGANTQHTIAEVTLPSAFVNVTYHQMVNGTDVAQVNVEAGVGDAPAVPAAFAAPFTTYTFDVEAITAATTDVYATAVFSMPFTVSTDYENATWYYLHGHATYTDRYISTNGDATVWGSGNDYSDAYKWAFIGNPVEGIKVINKASGEGKYLDGTDPATMTSNAKAWTLKAQTNYTGVTGEGKGFGLYDASLTYLNTQGATLKYWGSFDQGSTYWVEEIPSTPYYDDFNAVVYPYAEALNAGKTGYFYLANSGTALTNFLQAYNNAYANAQNNVDMTKDEYDAALGYFNDALVMPETGYYRLKSRMVDEGDTNYGYVGVNSSATLVGNIADPTADASTVFYVKKNSAGYYSFTSQGVYGTVASQSTPVVADATEHNFILGVAAPGYAYIKTASNVARSCYHVAASQGYQVVGWEAPANASQFGFEPATNVTVNMNVVGDASYATAYFPFPVQVTGAKVMRVEANTAAGKAFYYETANTVPSGTAVMLVAEDGAATATATIVDNAEALSKQNDLVGHYLAGNVSDALVLGASSGVIGFYKLSATGTLGANRAYIDNSTSSDVRALVLAAGETTGISNVATEAAQNGKAYDLAGRRVQNVQNGLYIINGKKVLVK